MNSFASIIFHVKLIFFSDGIKLYHRITSSFTFCFYKKILIERMCGVQTWGFFFKPSEMYFTHLHESFSHKKTHVNFTYYIIHFVSLMSTSEYSISDLSFTFTYALCSNRHIVEIFCKALKLLCFDFRITQKFYVAPLKTLNYTLVRLVVWLYNLRSIYI